MKNGIADAKVFVDSDGRPLKFRIQPSLKQGVKEELERDIPAHGGSVIDKVPLRGYVIIDPESAGGRALLEDWVWGDGTDRHFVSPSFVENCIDAGKLLQFTDEAKRVQEQRVLATKEIGSIIIAEHPVRPELPEETKIKLAAYLALMTPQNLSSCKVYQNLVYKKAMYPWVGTHKWQTFRNDYHKNRLHYDKLIRNIVDGASSKKSRTRPRTINLNKPVGPLDMSESGPPPTPSELTSSITPLLPFSDVLTH